MKILYLTHLEADYGAYCLWNGLCNVLGDDNVIDYPYKASYHGETDVYPSYYDEGRMGETAPLSWAVFHSGTKYNLEQIKDKLKNHEFDIVVCESPRATVCNSLEVLKELLPKTIVLQDSEDYEHFREDIIAKYNIKLYLKRELISSTLRTNYSYTIKPFPLSTHTIIPLDPVSAVRDIDILCACGDTNVVRKKIRSIVDGLGNKGLKVDTGYYIWDEYVKRMCRSKIAIAPRGWGQDSLRRWDSPACGAFLLAEKLTLIEETPMLDGIHCATYLPDGSDFEEKLLFYLKNNALRINIAADGQKYVLSHNSNVARAQQMLKWASEVYA